MSLYVFTYVYIYTYIYMYIYIAVSNFILGQICHELTSKQPSIDLKLSQILLVKSYFNEVLGIYFEMHGPTHPHTITSTSLINWIVQE
jgi:hypothetical protein